MLISILFTTCLSLFDCSNKLSDFLGDAAFAYREIYLAEGRGEEGKELGLNQVDDDWGLWGHHLGVVLPPDAPPSVFASVNGRTFNEQFCFSSDRLYQYIVEYINDNYGTKETRRFAILPNDNNYACQCHLCVAKGCTASNAAPAVEAMLERLATTFPNHIFFTSSYLTTRSVPNHRMPANTGVLISAIDYHLSVKATPQEAAFEELLKQWHAVTDHIYIWDYINNFDDYFTPYPVFTIMQRRFQLYQRNGVQGIFLNGSGSDYSTFSRLKTHVLAALLKDPDTDWREVLTNKCKEFYPVTGELVAQFLLSQEDYVARVGKPLPLYEGVAASRHIYFDEAAFLKFHQELRKLLPETQDSEKTEMSRMCRAMMLTVLELKRLNAQTDDTNDLLHRLSTVSREGARIYSESFWTVDSYVEDYQTMLHAYQEMRGKNRLRGVQLTPLTGLDEEYRDVSILTDGLLGLPSNYHCGQLLSSADPWLRLAIPNTQGLRHLRVCLTHNVQCHIAVPQRVTLSIGDHEIASVVPTARQGVAQHTYVDFDIPASASGTLILTLIRNKEERTMAIDEVYGW